MVRAMIVHVGTKPMMVEIDFPKPAPSNPPTFGPSMSALLRAGTPHE
jgi:hypothetical protein